MPRRDRPPALYLAAGYEVVEIGRIRCPRCHMVICSRGLGHVAHDRRCTGEPLGRAAYDLPRVDCDPRPGRHLWIACVPDCRDTRLLGVDHCGVCGREKRAHPRTLIQGV